MTHTDDLFAPDEAELRDLLERSMTGTTVPVRLGPQSLRHGRRLRARRRVAGVAGGVVATGVAAVLVVPLVLSGGSDTVLDPAGVPSSSATVSAPPLPDAAERPDGWWNMPATDMVAAVEAILPDGATVTSPGPLTADTPEGGPAEGWINATVAGPGGPGRLNVMLLPTVTPVSTDEGAQTAPGDGESDYITCDVGRPASGRTQCEQLRSEAGTVIGRRLTNRTGDIVMFEVTLRRGGGIVYAAAANTKDDKWGVGSPASADEPPLTLDQLEDLVRNDTWVAPAT